MYIYIYIYVYNGLVINMAAETASFSRGKIKNPHLQTSNLGPFSQALFFGGQKLECYTHPEMAAWATLGPKPFSIGYMVQSCQASRATGISCWYLVSGL